MDSFATATVERARERHGSSCSGDRATFIGVYVGGLFNWHMQAAFPLEGTFAIGPTLEGKFGLVVRLGIGLMTCARRPMLNAPGDGPAR